MAVLDIILLICFIPAIVQGLMKGFVKQIAGIVAIVAGAWAAYSFSGTVSAWISEVIKVSNPKVLAVTSYLVIALTIILALSLLGEVLTKMLNSIALGPVNRLLGLILSILKTGLILGFAILLFEYLNGTLHIVSNDVLQNSILYEGLKNAADKIFPFIKNVVGGLGNV